MKRFFCAALALLIVVGLVPAGLAEALPRELTLAPGESREFDLPFSGFWDSDAPEVATASGGVITGHEEGCAILALTGPEGDEWTVSVEVSAEAAEDADQVPELIQRAIDIGIQEWADAKGEPFPRSDTNKPHRGNKYCVWWGYDCGWCGAFANYCLDLAGVPLEPTDTYKKLKPTETGEPHGVREAAVPKLDTGFSNMERVTNIPRPGYLVLYGRRESKSLAAYAFVHVGLITDVIDRGDGTYQLFTVEGNLSSRIKRMSYLYDSTAKADRNMSAVPEEDRLDPATYQYTPHQDTWYVKEFCMTWY